MKPKAALMPERLRVMETWPLKSLKVISDIADVPGSQEYVRADIVASALPRLASAERQLERSHWATRSQEEERMSAKSWYVIISTVDGNQTWGESFHVLANDVASAANRAMTAFRKDYTEAAYVSKVEETSATVVAQ